MNLFKPYGITSESSLADIKRIYKKLAKQIHPDHNKSKNAAQEFTELQRQYDLLLSGQYDGDIKFHNTAGSRKKAKTSKTIVVELTLNEANIGSSRIVMDGNRLIDVVIPAGSINGDKITVPKSNYILEIKTISNTFVVDNLDIHLIHFITAEDYFKNNSFKIKNHLDREYTVNLEEGFDSRTPIKINKAGIFSSRKNKTGNMYITLSVTK